MLAVLTVMALVVYLAAVIRLRRTGVRPGPGGGPSPGSAGAATLFAVTGTWLNGYSMVLFSIHMTQHMVLSLIFPLLLLLRRAGHPGAAGAGCHVDKGPAGTPRALLLDALHSRFARFHHAPVVHRAVVPREPVRRLLHPAVRRAHGQPRGPPAHARPASWSPGCCSSARDRRAGPVAADLSHPGRILELFLPVPFHAFFGVSIMMAEALVVTTFADPPAGWGSTCSGTRARPAAVVAFGELPTVSCVLGVVFFSWASSDDRRGEGVRPGRRAQRRRRTRGLQRPPPRTGRTRLTLSQAACTTASSGRSSLVALISRAGDDGADHQQAGGPGEGGGVALDLRGQADGGVARVAAGGPARRGA